MLVHKTSSTPPLAKTRNVSGDQCVRGIDNTSVSIIGI